MPWKANSVLRLRTDFIRSYQSGLYTISELAHQYQISRPTAYKWIERFTVQGEAGLHDQSRRPHSCAHQADPQVRRFLIEQRKQHPSWGPLKILAYVQHKAEAGGPDNAPFVPIAAQLPAPSTLGDWLVQEGLVQRRKQRAKAARSPQQPLVAQAPNDVWCVDFKGQFRTGDGLYCYPFTASDAFSRFLLCADAYRCASYAGVQASMMRLFAQYGLPKAIRSDGGTPFCSVCQWKGLSQFGILLAKLGIEHQITDPGHPEQNGRHERMHRTLKAETACPPGADCTEQARRLNAFVYDFDYVRPHQALNMQTPGSVWYPSSRPLPSTLPVPEYARYMETRQVTPQGWFAFAGKRIFLSTVLAGEWLALEETQEGIWSVYFYHHLLARIDERDWKPQPAGPFVPQRSPDANVSGNDQQPLQGESDRA